MQSQYTHAGDIASIYGLVDPRDPGAVRYIGATRRPLDVRWSQHEHKALAGVLYKGEVRRYPIHDWIKDLHDDGVRPAIFLIDRVDRSLRGSAESYWMQCFRHHGSDLLNDRLPLDDPLHYVALLEARMDATGAWEYRGKTTLLKIATAA